jgi:radical SAM superfamily enzyme YgiQ (UPF0313 family)
MRQHILLVNPWVYDFAAYDFWSKPLGLLYIASMLRAEGHGVRLLDCMDRNCNVPSSQRATEKQKKIRFGRGHYRREIVEKPAQVSWFPGRYARYGISESAFIDTLRGTERPDIVMMTSGMTYWYPGVVRTIRLLKTVFPETPVLLGGIYATLCHEHASDTSGADIVLSGPFERQDDSLWEKWFGTPVSFPRSFTRWPFPAWDLYSTLDYAVLMTSRGCPFRCTYCAQHMLNPCFEQRDPVQVFLEFEKLYSHYRIRHFAFYDDALLVNPSEHILPLLERIEKMRSSATFHTPNGLHAASIGSDVAKKFRTTGFRTIRIGLESTDPVRQRATGGKVNNDAFHRAVEHLKTAGYKPHEIEVYVMAGIPEQPMEEILRSIYFVHGQGAAVKLVKYSPIPGTADWNRHIANSDHPAKHDPLWQDNSIFLHTRGEFALQRYRKLKNVVRLLNQKLH